MAINEKASCYDNCPIGHNCSGGFGYERECDNEVARIEEETGLHPLLITGQGLFFFEGGTRKLQLDEGMIKEVDNN